MNHHLVNPEDVPQVVARQIDSCVERTIEAGAKLPLTYLGAGMTAIVLCDERRHAFKAARSPTPTTYAGHEAEAEYLMTASSDARVRGKVAHFINWYPSLQVLERECVDGRPGGWGTRGLREAFEYIQRVMKEHGWSGPEFKEDSFVQAERGLVLVDAGFVYRHRENLVRYIEEVLAGKRMHPDPPSDLAFALRISMIDGEVAKDVGQRLHAELERRAGRKLEDAGRRSALERFRSARR